MSPNNFARSAKNRVRQVANRGKYEKESVHNILDQALTANVGFVADGSPFVMPMLFARNEDELIFHGSTKSRLMQMLGSGGEICISVSLTDGLVFAKSLFHHSMNYRSATVFGRGRLLNTDSEKNQALKMLSDKVMPGRWEDARWPSSQELKATAVTSIAIESGSAKIRTGGPIDDASDMQFPHWTGVVPIYQLAATPIPNPDDIHSGQIPVYIENWIEAVNDRKQHD